MGAYAFQNIQGSIVGPGGNLNLGYGSGAAEEGVSVSMSDEKGDTKVGADGTIMQSLRASKLGMITVRVLKTSPLNAALSAMYDAQTTLSSLWGNNVVRFSDVVRGDVITGTQMSFVKRPDLQFARDANINEWSFRGSVDQRLGTGDPVAQA